MDSVDVALRIFGAIAAASVSIAGAIWAALALFRRHTRKESAEFQIFKVYKDVLDELRSDSRELRTDSYRQANEMGRLAELVTKQTQVLIEVQGKMNEAQKRIEHLSEDRNKMALILADVKREQQKAIEAGDLVDPLADIPTNIFRHSGQ